MLNKICVYITICDIHMLILFHIIFRKQQHMDRLDFSACGSPTGLDLRDPYDLHVGEYYDLLSFSYLFANIP